MCCICLWASDAGTLNEEGSRALASGDLQTALNRFQSASKLDAGNKEVQFNIGLTLLRMGRATEAIVPLQGAASGSFSSSEARYLLSMAYFQLADYKKAAAEIEDIKESPRMDHVLYMREECNRLLGRVKEARQNFSELNRRFPDSSWLHFLLGNAFENQTQPEKALAEYKLALASDPHQPHASFAIGYLYWREQDYEKAKPWLQKELTIQSCHALASFYLGEIARTSQEPEAAIRYYRRSLECNPGSADVHHRLGSVLAELKHNDEALSELQRAVQLDPENSGTRYHLALLYKTLGRDADAREEYATVKRIQEQKAKADLALVTKP